MEVKSFSEDEYVCIETDTEKYFLYKEGLKWTSGTGKNVNLKLDFAGFIASVEDGIAEFNYGYITNVIENEEHSC